MVAMSSAFGHPEASTPHGGPAFQGWRKGYGFGKARGPGGYVGDPAIADRGRYTPAGERCYNHNAFWRGRTEVGQAASFGIGDRPSYTQAATLAPNHYGDVSKHLSCIRSTHTKKSITLKARFDSMEVKYRESGDRRGAGPGPAKYDTRTPTGRDSSTYTMNGRHMTGNNWGDILQPGPSEYNTRLPPGVGSPIGRSTLYEIRLAGRLPSENDWNNREARGQRKPGPGQYNRENFTDKYPLSQGMALAQGRVPQRKKCLEDDSFELGSLTAMTLEDVEEERPRQTSFLPRVESAPAL